LLPYRARLGEEEISGDVKKKKETKIFDFL
jgi:hypothetical protein